MIRTAMLSLALGLSAMGDFGRPADPIGLALQAPKRNANPVKADARKAQKKARKITRRARA